MQIFGLSLDRVKSTISQWVTDWPSASMGGWLANGGSGWFQIGSIRESFAGAWQRGVRLTVQTGMSHATAWSCITLIANDIAKLRMKLIAIDGDGIWSETVNPAYSPVLRRPNHYQNRIQFLTAWVISKLTRGNTYVLKERDARQVVVALHVLDPDRVQVLVAPDGEVYYELAACDLAGIEENVRVPATEIIHDILIPLYHPLVGVSAFYAMGAVVAQGLKIIEQSARLFKNGSQPGGIITSPTPIGPDAVKQYQQHWDENFGGEKNVGKTAFLGGGLKYESMKGLTAVDSQLIDQLKWGDEKICAVLHTPPFMVNVGTPPAYNNIEALTRQYYGQALQNLIESIELCLDEGLRLDATTGIELDLDGLFRMDTATQVKTESEAVKGSIKTPNEARKRLNLKPLPGGNTIYMQQQNFSLEALAKRDASDDPFKSAPPPSLPPAAPSDDDTSKTHVDHTDAALSIFDEEWAA
ncbi:MAG TPA: phage portal protein [Vicinamibacterales bacterium]